MVTDFISGLASVPIEMSEAVSWRHNNHFSDRGHHRHRHHHHHRHPPEDYPGGCPCLRKSGERGQASTDLTGGTQEKQPPRGEDHLQRWEQEVDQEGHEDGEDSTSEEGEEGSDTSYESAEDRLSNSEGASSDTTVADPEGLGNCGQELDLEKTMTRHLSKDLTSTQIVLSETGYHAGKFAKQVLNWVLLLPTDLTLSLSKGFHNAPKLYHDKTVLDTPKVRGVRSGFRAAGTVSALIPSLCRKLMRYRNSHKASTMASPAWSRSLLVGFLKRGPRGSSKAWGKASGGFFSSLLAVRLLAIEPLASSNCIGLWGLAGYPLSGIHKSLRNSISKSKTKEILQSRLVQGVEEMCTATTEERAEVIRRWHEIQKHDRASAHSNGHAG